MSHVSGLDASLPTLLVYPCRLSPCIVAAAAAAAKEHHVWHQLGHSASPYAVAVGVV